MAASNGEAVHGRRFDVIVVGAGIMGSCAAYAASSRGARALLLERFDLLHHRGSSHGESRTIRATYPQPHYPPMARLSRRLWEEAQADAGYRVLTPTPHLDLGPRDDPDFRAAVRNGGAAEVADPSSWPWAGVFRVPDGWTAATSDLGGVMKATKAVAMFQALAVRNGAVVRDRTEVVDISKRVIVESSRRDNQAVEEEQEDPYYFVDVGDGVILEVVSDGELRSPRALPSPPAAPAVPATPALDAAGGDPGDPGDDTEDDDGTDDDEEENEGTDEYNDFYYEGPREGESFCLVHSSEVESGYFPWLLRQTLQELGNTVYPMYITHSWTEPPLGTYYMTRVHIRERDIAGRGYITCTAHDSTTPHSTYRASISNAARRALWSLRSRHHQELSLSDYRHVPHRTSGTEQTVVPLVGSEDRRLNILAQVTAGLNTDLEGATVELDQTHVKLKEAYARIAQLEAERDGIEPPAQPDETPLPAVSPPRKRLRHGSSLATTGLLD